MPDPTTANTSLTVPLRGADVGTWDVPMNGNFTLIDSMFGGVAALALTNLPVTLSSTQAQISIIRLTGTLTGNVAITLPGIYKFWTIDNQLTNSPSSFYATLVSTSGASVIGLPPGPQDVFYDGTTVNYRNLGKLGEYWDYAANAVPNWVLNSTKPPYLYCSGSAFSSATYPQLANLLGTTTLPDFRGRASLFYNDGTGRLTSAGAGIDGNTLFATGGSDGTTLVAAQIPTITSSGTITVNTGTNNIPGEAGFAITNAQVQISGASGSYVPQVGSGVWTGVTSFSGNNTMTYTNGAQTNVKLPAPGAVGGIRMIRAM